MTIFQHRTSGKWPEKRVAEPAFTFSIYGGSTATPKLTHFFKVPLERHFQKFFLKKMRIPGRLLLCSLVLQLTLYRKLAKKKSQILPPIHCNSVKTAITSTLNEFRFCSFRTFILGERFDRGYPFLLPFQNAAYRIF